MDVGRLERESDGEREKEGEREEKTGQVSLGKFEAIPADIL